MHTCVHGHTHVDSNAPDKIALASCWHTRSAKGIQREQQKLLPPQKSKTLTPGAPPPTFLSPSGLFQERRPSVGTQPYTELAKSCRRGHVTLSGSFKLSGPQFPFCGVEELT